MPPDNRPPRLGSDTLRSRAAASGQIAEAKSQTRQRVAEDFETQSPEEVALTLNENRIEPTRGFLDRARPMEAAAEFDPQFPRQDVGPDDVQQTDKGFQPEENVRRRKAAFEFEDQTPLEDVDPQQGIASDGDGFGLATPARRRLGAIQLDDQFPQQDLSADDVKVTDSGVRPEEGVQRRKAARELTQQTPLSNIDPFSDLKQTGSGFELAGDAESKLNRIQRRRRQRAINEARQETASQFDEQIEDVDIGTDDVTRIGGNRFGLADNAQSQIEQELRSDFLQSNYLTEEDIKVEVTERGVEAARIRDAYTPEPPEGRFSKQVVTGGKPLVRQRVSLGLSDSEFINSEDFNVDVSDTGIETEFTQPDVVEERIETNFTESEFITPADVAVDVTEQGIEEARIKDPTTKEAPPGQVTTQPIDAGVGVVEDRLISELTSSEFVNRQDVNAEVTNRGIMEVGIREGRRDDIAARQFESETALEEVNPNDDLRQLDDGGFGLTDSAERRAVAESVEDRSPLDEVDPREDLKRDGDQFELGRGAAERLFDLNPDFTF